MGFGAFHINMVGYQSQVIPAILVGILFSVLLQIPEKACAGNDLHDRSTVLFSLVPAVLLAHTDRTFRTCGGDGLAKIIQVGFDSSFSWIVSGIYGLLYPLYGYYRTHHAMLPIDLQAAETVGGIYTFPVVALNNIAQASAVVAFVIINRRNAKGKKRLVFRRLFPISGS